MRTVKHNTSEYAAIGSKARVINYHLSTEF